VRGVLSDQSGKGGPVSPLVDVIFNAMAAVFIILIIYVAVARPEQVTELRIDTLELPEASWYSQYEAGLHAAGGRPPYVFEVEEELPRWVALDPDTGWLRGNPRPAPETLPAEASEEPVEDAGESSTYAITAVVRDSEGRSAEKELTLTVKPARIPFDHREHPLGLLVGGELPRGVVGVPYAAVLGPVGGIEPYALAVSLPDELGLTYERGMILGTPRAPGQYQLEVSLQDAQVQYGVSRPERIGLRTALSMEVLPRVGLRILDVLPDARRGEEYAALISARGGAPPYTWGLDTSLPAGLRVEDLDASDVGDGTLRLSGRPEAEGAFRIGVRVRDDTGAEVQHATLLRVLPPLPPFSVVGELPPARVGTGYGAALATVGGTAPFRWELVEGDLPEGMQLAGPVISGTPTRPGRTSVRMRVLDARGETATRSVDLVVEPRRRPLEVPRLGESP